MIGMLTIYSASGKGEPLTLRDVVDMIESLGGSVSGVRAVGAVDFDLDAPLQAKVNSNGATFDDAKIISLSFRVSGTDA